MEREIINNCTFISIHAPRTGSDGEVRHHDAADAKFQSTLPARGATGRADAQLWRWYFNPRSPHGERRFCGVLVFRDASFQSTLPARGATLLGATAMPRRHYFNPRSPHGERPSTAVNDGVTMHISIHAPRTGSDWNGTCSKATLQISIHAPRTGSDKTCGENHLRDATFQSTLPARGATSPA